jgi:hypothetical protein
MIEPDIELIRGRLEKRKIQSPIKSQLYPREGTLVCIEGFPRCGNTFLLGFFLFCHRPRVDLSCYAHHTHDLISVQFSAYTGIETYVTCRDPLSSIASAGVYLNESLDVLLDRYVNFYRGAWRLRERVKFVEFDCIKSGVVSLSEYLGNPKSEIAAGACEKQIHQWIKQAGEDRFGGDADAKMSIPNCSRERLLANCREGIIQHPRIAEAQNIYEKIRSWCEAFSN